MDWLSPLGFDAFIGLGISSRAPLFLAPHTVAARLIALDQLVEPSSEHQRLIRGYWRRVEVDGLLSESTARWNDTMTEPDSDRGNDPHTADEVFEVTVGSTDGKLTSDEPDAGSAEWTPPEPASLVLQFRTAHGVLGRTWDFHKGDADPYPSIPHGHAVVGNRAEEHPKLDAYLGHVYDGSGRIVTRESRTAIIALWNDEKFRTFAFAALVHALDEDPTLSGALRRNRGIKDPLALPRRR
jgi:hypothetical protein